jgi:hypothetical protein
MSFDTAGYDDKKVAVVGEMSIAALINNKFHDNEKQIGRRGTYKFVFANKPQEEPKSYDLRIESIETLLNLK